ncbi:hypothetical protein ASPBRDRAFT_404213 [Aspergillus brasiliensis CBS 101740]|uniref:Uncharacterized protein n=1 Tax=Aspergillus brasiliensis (strain CBS 101740 / IMI 381727 / IBT 21946) TaxID=767769 RepID=A0A1L9UXG7_ASPBC|nr:hypothetical protein ASPBRDRAFT_404213 [Aspergillus brasiliensis CBS 101740]
MRLIGLAALRCVLQGTLAPFPWLRRSPFFPNSFLFPFPRSLSTRLFLFSLSPSLFRSPLLLLFAACLHHSLLSPSTELSELVLVPSVSTLPLLTCPEYPPSPSHLLNWNGYQIRLKISVFCFSSSFPTLPSGSIKLNFYRHFATLPY